MDPNNNQPSNPVLNSNSQGAAGSNLAGGTVLDSTNGTIPSSTGDMPVDTTAPMQNPVNPIINPGSTPNIVNPIIQPGGNGLAATDPIMRPEPAPTPDPVEEELKAPMKANAPVPGSIGSAVSGPADGGDNSMIGGQATNPFANNMQDRATSVSFNDPAMQMGNEVGGAKKTMSMKDKKLLIALIAVMAVIVIVLVVFLVVL